MELLLFAVGVVFYLKLHTIDDRLRRLYEKLDRLERSLDGSAVASVPQVREAVGSLRVQEEPESETAENAAETVQDTLRLKPRHAHTPFWKRFGDVSLESFLVGNLLLKVSVVAFVLGVGFFLKYSIDRNWIPVEGRMLIGIGIGFGMVALAVRFRDRYVKPFSEVLFGGAIAVLYLSVYAGFALPGFAFLSSGVAFGAMVAITLFAGFVSLHYDSMTSAVFGLLGGFATPFLIQSGSENVQALMLYILLLNLGLLYIAFSKRWDLLNILSFAATMLIELSLTSARFDAFFFLQLLFFLIFVIYSLLPFLHALRSEKVRPDTTQTTLFGANTALYLLASARLFHAYGYDFRYFGIVTTAAALYLLFYAWIIVRKGAQAERLYPLPVAYAVALGVLTPAIVLDGKFLSGVWAVEGALLLYLSQKTLLKSQLYFAMIAFALSSLTFLIYDLGSTWHVADRERFGGRLWEDTLSVLLLSGSSVYAQRIRFHERFTEIVNRFSLRYYLAAATAVLLFCYFNVELYTGMALFYPAAKQVAVTLLWVVFGMVLFVLGLKKGVSQGRNAAIGLILLAVVKAFFVDLAGVDPIYRILLFIVVGLLLFSLAFYYRKAQQQ